MNTKTVGADLDFWKGDSERGKLVLRGGSGDTAPEAMECLIFKSAEMLPNARFGVYVIHNCSNLLR